MQSPCFNDTSIHLIEGARAERSQEQHGGHDGKESSRGNRAGAGRNRHFARKSRGTDAEAYRVCVGSGPGAGDKRRDGGRLRDGRRQTTDGRLDGGGQTADHLPSALCFVCRLPSAICRLETTNGETGRSRFPRLLLKRPTSSSRPSSFQPFSWPFCWQPWFNLL